MAIIQGWLLFKGGYYSRVAAIQRWLFFKGGYYSTVAIIQGWLLYKDNDYYPRVANPMYYLRGVTTYIGVASYEDGYYRNTASIQPMTIQYNSYEQRIATG